MAPSAKSAGKLPVTVVTGFLGSGKTTLVNHILKNKEGLRLAVIENEFGEVGIDDGLVLESKEEILEMNNGCICCTVRGDLLRIVRKLLKKKGQLDGIVIETTGLANPGPVIQTFLVDDEIKEGCVLDSVLTLVDCAHITPHLDEEKPEGVVNEAVQQVAFADKLLLNKTDLVSEADIRELEDRLRDINAGAQIILCRNAQVDLAQLLGISAFSLDRLMEVDPRLLGEAEKSHDHHHHDHDHHDCSGEACTHESHHGHDHHHHDHDHDHACAGDSCTHESHHYHHHHKHDDRVSSVGIQMEGQCDMGKLNTWLSGLLQQRGPDLYRSKGILSIAGSDDKHVFHGVHMLLQFSSSKEGAGRPWATGEPRINKLVFIGKNLNRQELTDSFKACLVNPPPAAA